MKRLAGGVAVLAVVAAVGVAAFKWGLRQDEPRRNGVVPAAEESPDGEEPLLRYHALVIGINEYAAGGANGWNDLVNARGDAEAVAESLESDYGFEVTRLTDGQATQSAIIEQLDALTSLTDRDAALIYYAGHGYYDERLNEGYWIPSDAPAPEGSRVPREKWIWNSMITKLVGASMARHVLIIADSCYSGSLLRGGLSVPADRELEWYRRAIRAPSRYVITSGSVEPVLDSGVGHSIFAQQVLNYLKYPGQDVFSASDLGIAIRNRVSELARQMPLSQHLPVASDAGGEFVFMRSGSTAKSGLMAAPVDEGSSPTPDIRRAATNAASTQQAVQDAVLLANQGATGAAHRVLASLAIQNPESRLVQVAAGYLDQKKQQERREHITQLLDRVETLNEAADPQDLQRFDEYAKPRIIACMGPINKNGGIELEGLAGLYQACLYDELNQIDSHYTVEREGFDVILEELGLSGSDLSDRRAQIALGQVLPASLLLLGDLRVFEGQNRFSMRLVETKSGRILQYFRPASDPAVDVEQVCRSLAEEIAGAARNHNALEARVLDQAEGGSLLIGAGSFHLIHEETAFTLVERSARNGDPSMGMLSSDVGSATVEEIGDIVSRVQPAWREGTAPDSLKNVWAVEVTEK